MHVHPQLPLFRLTVPTPFPVGPVNLYVITEPETVLIDCGPKLPDAEQTLLAGLAGIGLSPAGLRKIILTHFHVDHAGFAAELVRRSGAVLYANETERDLLRNDQRMLAWYSRLVLESGTPPRLQAKISRQNQFIGQCGEPLTAFRSIEEADGVPCGPYRLRLIHTPGHTPGSISFWCEELRLLLAADTVIANITPNPFCSPDPEQPTGRFRALPAYFDSLDRLSALRPEIVHSGHGEPVADLDAYRELALRLHLERQEAVLDCLAGGAATVHEVAACLFPAVIESGAFLALAEVYAHFDLLEEEGRVARKARDGVAIYSLLQQAAR